MRQGSLRNWDCLPRSLPHLLYRRLLLYRTVHGQHGPVDLLKNGVSERGMPRTLALSRPA